MIAVLQASGDVWFWLIVAVFVVISKIAGKLKDVSETGEPPVAPTGPRPRPAQRRARPRPPVAAAPPLIPRAEPRRWTASANDLQEFLGRIQQSGQESGSLPVKPLPVAQPVPQPRLAPPPEPPPVKAPAPPAAPVASARRSAQWAAALRDRQNIRNIIIAAEIIGSPKAEQF